MNAYDKSSDPYPVLYQVTGAIYIRFTNLTDSAFMIEDYSLESPSENGAWSRRAIIPVERGNLYMTVDYRDATGIETKHAFGVSANGKMISVHETIEGWIYFVRKNGDSVPKMRLRITDTTGRVLAAALETGSTDGSVSPQSGALITVGQHGTDLSKMKFAEWGSPGRNPTTSPTTKP